MSCLFGSYPPTAQVDFQGTLNLLALARQRALQKFVLVSSIGADDLVGKEAHEQHACSPVLSSQNSLYLAFLWLVAVPPAMIGDRAVSQGQASL